MAQGRTRELKRTRVWELEDGCVFGGFRGLGV